MDYASHDVLAALGMWGGLIMTLLIASSLLGDGVSARLGQHLLVGAAVGYGGVLAVQHILRPQVIAPLLADPLGDPWLWIPAVLGGLLLVAGVDRSEPPGGTGTDASPQATVPASVDQAWTSGGWGPAGSDDPAPPLPEGFTPVLAWARFPTTGWTVDVVDAGLVDGTLVLAAERTAPGVGCVNAQVLTGVSYLLGVRVDGDVTPATPVEVRFIDRTVDC